MFACLLWDFKVQQKSYFLIKSFSNNFTDQNTLQLLPTQLLWMQVCMEMADMNLAIFL